MHCLLDWKIRLAVKSQWIEQMFEQKTWPRHRYRWNRYRKNKGEKEFRDGYMYRVIYPKPGGYIRNSGT